MDTALGSPDDAQPWKMAPAVMDSAYVAQPRSVVILARALQEAGA